ncbi:MAG: hypothetical protein A2Y38_17315 [Spirochaetes bacterium GWB1_59_5]|nr:MAG: hypothetical protein A2Y38_17315 [Spirochaetes bacterium GWB1_59_5]
MKSRKEVAKAKKKQAKEPGTITVYVQAPEPLLIFFFYTLARDHLPIGTIEKLVADVEAIDGDVSFSSAPLTDFATEIVKRLKAHGDVGQPTFDYYCPNKHCKKYKRLVLAIPQDQLLARHYGLPKCPHCDIGFIDEDRK